MDKDQEELQFIGFFGIFRESCKIISIWRELFFKLALTLTLPLSFLYLAHTEINHLLSQNISRTIVAVTVVAGDPDSQEIASRALLRGSAWYLVIEVAYVIFLFVFSLLSNSAVVYTVASIYSGKKVAFREVFRVVPKIWKRLMVTFLCYMAILSFYNFVFISIVAILIVAIPIDIRNVQDYVIPGAIVFVLYLASLVYMSVIWQLANTISILEESYGFQALRKSKILIKGKMGISLGILMVNNLCVGGTLKLYNSFVVFDKPHVGILMRVGFGVISLVLLCTITLVGLVVLTMFYLVCKSYHNERIDKTALLDLLEVYQGEGYVLLKPKDIQLMEQV